MRRGVREAGRLGRQHGLLESSAVVLHHRHAQHLADLTLVQPRRGGGRRGSSRLRRWRLPLLRRRCLLLRRRLALLLLLLLLGGLSLLWRCTVRWSNLHAELSRYRRAQ